MDMYECYHPEFAERSVFGKNKIKGNSEEEISYSHRAIYEIFYPGNIENFKIKFRTLDEYDGSDSF